MKKIHTVTLNINDETIDNYGTDMLDKLYKSLEGWNGYKKNVGATWFGDDKSEKYVYASFEISGVMLCGHMEEEWLQWLEKFLKVSSSSFGYRIHDITE